MRLILKRIFSLIPEGKILYYWFFSWYFLSLIEIIPTLPSLFEKSILQGFFGSFVMLTAGVYINIGIPVLRFFYESVNNLYIADFEYGYVTTLIAMVLFWTPILVGIILIILLPFITQLIIREKANILWFPPAILTYLIFLFFWRGKGLEDEDYFWLFLFPGVLIYLFIINIFFRFNKDE